MVFRQESEEIFFSLMLQIGGVLLSDPRSSSSSARRSYQTQTHLRYFHCTEVSYCVHTHNEEQVIYVMQCDETNLCVFFSLHRG